MTLVAGDYPFTTVMVEVGQTLYISGAVTMDVSGSFNLPAGATIIGDGAGYGAGMGTGAGSGYGGGGHGGAGGGAGNLVNGGPANDVASNPAFMGSGGGGSSGSGGDF